MRVLMHCMANMKNMMRLEQVKGLKRGDPSLRIWFFKVRGRVRTSSSRLCSVLKMTAMVETKSSRAAKEPRMPTPILQS